MMTCTNGVGADYVARRNMEAGCEMHGREGRGRLSESVVAVVSVLACIAMLAGLVMGTTHVVGWVFDAIGTGVATAPPDRHRASWRHPGMLPEKSPASIRAAKQNGADFAEIDVRLTKDGIPVVFHDRRTGRLDAGGRNVLVHSMSFVRIAAHDHAATRHAVFGSHAASGVGRRFHVTSGAAAVRLAAGHQDGRAVCPESGRCRGACGRGFQISPAI